MILTRTASVLLTDQEVRAVGNGLRIIYRPLTMHWDGQLGKFKEPRQPTIDGTHEPDVVHLMRDTGKTYTVERTGEVRPVIVKVESREISEISDKAVFPDGYHLEYDNLEAMDQCWAVVLGQKV